MNNQPYKRQYRQVDDDVKQRISASTRNKPKTEQHKEHIRQGMIRYWETVPNRENEQCNNQLTDLTNEKQI